MTKLECAFVELLERLERISLEYEELTDTDVRESIHLALNRCFVWGKDCSRFPRCFGMFSADGDLLVANAIRQFLDSAERSGELPNIPVGQARLDVLQSGNATTADGMIYDELIGYRDTPLSAEPLPEHMFFEGEYGE